MSAERLAEYKATTPCEEYCEGPAYSQQLAQARRGWRGSAKTVVSASRMGGCRLPSLKPTPYLQGLFDVAVDNMRKKALARRRVTDDMTGREHEENKVNATKKSSPSNDSSSSAEGSVDNGDDAAISRMISASSSASPVSDAAFSFVVFHWRRGDKCFGAMDPVWARGRARRCVGDPRVLRACARLAAVGRPVYIASDESDPTVLARWQASGCLTWPDTGLVGRPDVTNADSIFVDLMLMSRGLGAWSLGDSSLDRFVTHERQRLGFTSVMDVFASD